MGVVEGGIGARSGGCSSFAVLSSPQHSCLIILLNYNSQGKGFEDGVGVVRRLGLSPYLVPTVQPGTISVSVPGLGLRWDRMMVSGCLWKEKLPRGLEPQISLRVGNEHWMAEEAAGVPQRLMPLVPAFEEAVVSSEKSIT